MQQNYYYCVLPLLLRQHRYFSATPYYGIIASGPSLCLINRYTVIVLNLKKPRSVSSFMEITVTFFNSSSSPRSTLETITGMVI